MSNSIEKIDAVLEATKMTFDDLARQSHTLNIPEVVDKSDLVGKELIVVDARFTTDGDYGPFVSLTCRLRSGETVVINDGSTGIYKQLADGDVQLPLYCAKGLRVSEYPYGESGARARTYYLTGGKKAA